MQLIDLGWDSFFDKEFESHKNMNFVPARIARENRSNYIAFAESGELVCEISGKLRFGADSRGKFPTVGDWVVVAPRPEEGRGIIQALLPRKSAFLRKVAGMTTEEQVIAANIDIVFIVCGLDGNFNRRRIERYLSVAWESGAMPVVVLNKADLCPNPENCLQEVETVAIGVDVHIISASQKTGLDFIGQYCKRSRTAAFLGSSGVGKSTIINSLIGFERLKVGEVREDDSRGRHTTTSRELLLLPGGGLVIDTPGMRELQVWGNEDGLNQAFEDIEEMASSCRFRDCEHKSEPGCAVREAIGDGRLLPERFQSFLKLKKELRYLAARQSMKANMMEKERWKKISQYQKNLKKHF